MLTTGMGAIAGLLIGLLIYLWMPDESSKSRKKRKQALLRMKKVMAGSVSSPCSPVSSASLQERPAASSLPLLHHHREPAWRHDKTDTFYRRYIAPHRNLLQHAGYLDPVNALLSLLDQYGDCPSVVKMDGDTEYRQIQNSYDLLAHIPLLDHSLNVAEQMIQAVVKTKARDPELLIGKILLTALGHDIGKVPQLILSKKYSKGDHPYTSYLILKKAIFTKSTPQQEEILKAVRDHHFQVREGFTYALRKADQAAREIEMDQLASAGRDVSDLVRTIRAQNEPDPGPGDKEKRVRGAQQAINLGWLDLKEFLGLIEPHINVEKDGRFQACSMQNGLVYLMLNLVFETVIHLAEKHNHPELPVNADTKEKMLAIEYAVKNLLSKQGFIPSFIGTEYVGAKFAVVRRNSNKKSIGFYMPVEAKAFKTPLRDLEKRKKTAPAIKEISEIRPLVGKKNP